MIRIKANPIRGPRCVTFINGTKLALTGTCDLWALMSLEGGFNVLRVDFVSVKGGFCVFKGGFCVI